MDGVTGTGSLLQLLLTTLTWFLPKETEILPRLLNIYKWKAMNTSLYTHTQRYTALHTNDRKD